MPAERTLTVWEVAEADPGSIEDPSSSGLDALEWLPTSAPGTAASALRDAGRWSEGDDVDFDDRDWWFRCRFSAEPGEHLLRFDGLATIADVWLNGTHVLHSENMFHPHRSVVTASADNELVIVCRSLNRHLAGRRPRPRWKTRLVANQSLRWARTTFLGRMPGWTPKCAPVGPWRPVTLVSLGQALSVDRLVARPVGDGGVVDVELRWWGAEPLAASVAAAGADAELDCTVEDGCFVLRGRLAVADVPRWQPSTAGVPHLVGVTAEIVTVEGATLSLLGRVGFRDVVADTADDGFALSLDGVPTFCRGVCWMPTDVARLSDDPAAIRAAVEQLRDAGCNMIRVVGTAVYEQSAFYEACDELGVMVWHDAMFANVDQPLDDDEYRDSVVTELRAFLAMVARHPSVVVVCGGSEVEQQAVMMGVSPEEGRNRVGRELLPALVDELVPGTPVVPCSPSGGVYPFHLRSGVSHYYGVGAYLRPLDDVRSAGVRFTTECLAFSNVPCRETVEQLLGETVRPGHSPEWKRRVPRDVGSGWDFEDVRDHYVREIFGVDPMHVRYSDPDRYLDLGRAAVAVAIESTVSALRRPRSGCGGAMLLMGRDLWVGAGWGVVDSAGRPKSALRALAHASAPRTVLLHDDGLDGLTATIHNDLLSDFHGSVQFSLFAADGTTMSTAASPVDVAAGRSCELSVDAAFGAFRDIAHAYRFGPRHVDSVAAVLLDESGSEVARIVTTPGGHRRPVEHDLGLEASATPAGCGWQLTLTSRRFAQFVSIDAPRATPSDDWFHLAPGERRDVTLRVGHGVTPPRFVEVRALNSMDPVWVPLEVAA